MNVYIFTISDERAHERHALCRGGLLALQVPPERTRFFLGADHIDYPTTEAVCEAAIADGFPGFEARKDTHAKAIVAQVWSYFQMWRAFAERGETALYLHDDGQLAFLYQKYVHLTDFLTNYDENFTFLGLSSKKSIKEMNEDTLLHDYTFLDANLAGGISDFCAIVTPKFYEWVLEAYFHQSYLTMDSFLQRQVGKTLPGFYSVPAELSCKRHSFKTTPSMIFDNERLAKGEYVVKEQI